ncbi:hypothetical protein ROZALSC1DRAFT_25880, partial [Rozella allomycis CSF55]
MEYEPMKAIMMIPKSAPPQLHLSLANTFETFFATVLITILKSAKINGLLMDLVIRHQEWEAKNIKVTKSQIYYVSIEDIVDKKSSAISAWDFETIRQSLYQAGANYADEDDTPPASENEMQTIVDSTTSNKAEDHKDATIKASSRSSALSVLSLEDLTGGKSDSTRNLTMSDDFPVMNKPNSPIFLLHHGGGHSLHSWQLAAEKLFQQGFEVFCYDMRAH